MVISLSDSQFLAREPYCYLTTIGRKSGKPHTIEIWFAMSPDGKALYLLSGGRERSDWVKNITHNSSVEVRIGGRLFKAHGRLVTDPDEELSARRLVVAKYYGREYNPSGGWEATSLVVALDLEV